MFEMDEDELICHDNRKWICEVTSTSVHYFVTFGPTTKKGHGKAQKK